MDGPRPTTEDLTAALRRVRASPADQGALAMIVRRPELLEREEVAEGRLDVDVGLVGDNWLQRGSRHTDDGTAESDRQLTLMNARAIGAIAGDRSRWPLAGDQLYVDLDLSPTNLAPGARLSLGQAEVEVTAAPHLGCAKFRDRFGADAARFVNSDEGKALNLRGINARVVRSGDISTGDAVVVLDHG